MKLKCRTCRLSASASGTLVGLALLAASPGFAADTFDLLIPGRPVVEVVDHFRDDGLLIAYSLSVLTPEMLVLEVPQAEDPTEIIREILIPFALEVTEINGVLVVGRKPQRQGSAGRSTAVGSTAGSERAKLSEVTVSASRYEILLHRIDPTSFIDQDQMQKMPVLGDDPIRAAAFVPGFASSGGSAKSYARGGESIDSGIVLNGNRLVEPYHVRNFQSLFSSIDARAIEGVEVYSGNFPVQYGNQMGAMMIVDTIEPPADRHSEIGLSVFNTSILTTGSAKNSKYGWLISARRGNLDQVISDEYGEPSYSDVFIQLSAKVSPSSNINVNGLIANDTIDLITEGDVTEPEESRSSARTAQFWVDWKQQWNSNLRGVTTFSITQFSDYRDEFANDPLEIVASIKDRRHMEVVGLAEDLQWNSPSGRNVVRIGLEYEWLRSKYEYDGSAQYFGVFRMVEGVPESKAYASSLDLSGNAIGLYMSSRINISDHTAVEFGARWDVQRYGNSDDTGQLSPRVSLAHKLGTSTELRASVGRFHQAQGIHQLQVEDGIETFFPAQRTDSATFGLQHRFSDRLSARVEAYWKSGDRIRPRYENVLNSLTVLPEFKPDRQLISATEFRSRGIELSVRSDSSENRSWWASYVLSSADDRLSGKFVPRSWDQRHAFRLGLSVSAQRWDFGLVATAHSGWPETSLVFDNSNPDAPALLFTERNRQQNNTFATLDLRVRYDKPVRVGSLSFFFEVSNATNRENTCCVDFDVDTNAPGAPVFEMDHKNWLPLTPSLGVLWQF